MRWQFIVNPFLRRDKIIVSHFSPFLFYLYVLASVQRENCLARDKSIPAIPNMPWFHWKKWFVLRQARNHSHRPSQSHHGHCQWKWPEGKCPSRRSFVLAMMHRHKRPPHPPNYIHLLRGCRLLSKDDGMGCKASCAALGGHFRRHRQWLAIVVMIVVDQWSDYFNSLVDSVFFWQLTETNFAFFAKIPLLRWWCLALLPSCLTLAPDMMPGPFLHRIMYNSVPM